jgi:hypothetical protein
MMDERERLEKTRSITDDQLQAMAMAARLKRDRLLRQHPHLQTYQDEIDRRLNAAGGPANRLAVLGFMLEAKLAELKGELTRLGDLTRQTLETDSP